MNSVTNIESLPQEVLLHVFSFLSPVYLCTTVSQVCTIWEDLCGDPLLYRELKFTQGEVSEQTVVKILKAAPLLSSLTLIDWDDIETILEVVSPHNQKIRALALETSLRNINTHVAISSEVMMKILQNCTELETLILRNYVVRGKELYNNICIQLPQLKTLHITDNGTFRSEFLVHLANSSLELEHLKIYEGFRFYISEHPYSDNITPLCNRFCKTLRSLRLCFLTRISHEAYAALQKCDRLETLGISYLKRDDSENIIAISSIPNLRHLILRGCWLPEAVPMRLFSSEGLKNLVSLKLLYCDVPDRLAAAIGDHLKNLTTIAINSDDSGLTMAGMKSVLKGCSKLRNLTLIEFERKLTEEAILLIPQYLPGLRSLSVFPRADGAVAQIKTKMPELQIKYKDLYRYTKKDVDYDAL